MSRLNELLQQAGNIGRNEDGSITRLGFSEKYFEVLEFLKGRMQELGMQVETDPVGNLHGVLQGSDPEAKSIVIGSHMDTVMQGGIYDGMLGVTGALEVAARLKDEGRTLRHPLEIWGFNMEESSILGGTFGSRCVTGMLDPDIPGYAEKLAKFGCSPEKAKAAKRDISKYECYLEYHIEQGDKLDHTGIDVGVVSGIVSNLSGMFDSTNEQIGEIAGQVGLTPQGWNSGIFNMIQNLSNNVILPLAGAILAIVMTLELIQLITDRNNLNDVDTWMFFKWVFKSAAAVLIVSNTWTIVMGIFDAAQSVVNGDAGVMIGNNSIDISSVVTDLESRLMEMDVGPLLGLWFQSLFVGICTWAITICIFIVIYGRMIEVYLVTSVAPIPMATMANREWGQMGQNYLRTLLALGFQAFLIMVCVAIYSVLVQNISVSGDISNAIWTCMGYTVLLCFCLFKTSSLARSVFNAH